MKRTLLGTHLWIEQNRSQAFNLDTILLADFVRIPKRTKHILDIGTGAGALMLYISQKSKAHITGIEVQENRYQQSVKNIELNHLEDRLSCIHQDVKTLTHQPFDVILSNPPFFKMEDHHKVSQDQEDFIARHEVLLDLESLIQSASRLLKYSGYFFLIHRPERMQEITELMSKHKLAIKIVRFVHPYKDQKANHVLIEAVKEGSYGLALEPPLILYESKHVLTEEMNNIYGGRSYVTIHTQSKREVEVS